MSLLQTKNLIGHGPALLLLALLAAQWLSGQTAEEIMSRVAENQDRALSMRTAFVYHQNLLVRMKRANGNLAREEIREFTVTPNEKGVEKQLTHFAGKYDNKGKILEYSEPGFHYKDLDIDGEIVGDLAEELANDERSRDGIERDMFPLTARQQRGYVFHLHGKETYRDAEVFRITFEPKAKDENEKPWSGEALIDTREYEPVLVTTHLAKGVPLLVKTLFGTDLKQVGFKVAYRKFDEGLWFPVTYGGELKLRALFLYARSMSIGVVNSDFKRTNVETSVRFGN